MKTIGIDIGTTTICGVVLDLESGRILSQQTIPNDSFIGQEKIQDVKTILKKAKELLDDCLKVEPDVKAIGLTGQMHGIVYVDETGQAVSPLYTWQDQSGLIPLENGKCMVDMINQYVSHPVATGYGLVTYAYHQSQNQVPTNAKKICTIMDYLGMVLTQRTSPLVHVSNAASFGFFDLASLQFDITHFSRFQMNPDILPEVTKEMVSLGTYQNIPVLVALGDNQASFLSTVGLKTDEVLVNMGTGGQVSLCTDRYVEVSGVETRPFIQGKYLLVGASLCGGRAYAILENFFRQYVKMATGKEESQYETMAKMMDIPRDSSPLKVQTTLKGTRQDPNQQGSILCLSEDNFLPEYLIHGVMVGMIDELYEMYEKMLTVIHTPILSLKVSGNAIRKNHILRSICEARFGLSSQFTRYEEEAACGAALSGGLMND